MQARAISGPWAAGERILVCVSEDPRSAGLVRYAKRLADRLHAPWTALYVETPRSLQLSEEERDRIAERLRLAERSAAKRSPSRRRGARIADDVIDYAHANNVTHIIIGKSTRSRWFEILHGSVVHDLVRRAGNISVHVIAGDELRRADRQADGRAAAAAASRSIRARMLMALWSRSPSALGVGLLIQPWLGIENVDLVFLTAIVGVAVRYGLWPSLLASVAASLCYNFFFLPPIYTFTITDPTNVAAFVFFTIMAVIVSNVAARVRVAERSRRSSASRRPNRSMRSAASSPAPARSTTCCGRRPIRSRLMLKVRVVLLLPENGTIAVKAGYPPEDSSTRPISPRPNGPGRTIGRPAAARIRCPAPSGCSCRCTPAAGAIGIVGIDSDKPGPLLTPDQRRLLDALIDQGALAIERVHLVEDIDRVKRTAETDRLRSALLTSISHDLKTPLAAVLGAAGTLRDLEPTFDDGAEARSARHHHRRIRAAQSLHRQPARHDQAGIGRASCRTPRLHDLGEIVGSALRRAGKILAQHRVEVELATDLPMVESIPCCSSRCLFNLLDNAAKYAPPDTTIRIQSWRDGSRYRLQVSDEGDGIPPGRSGAHLRQVLSRHERPTMCAPARDLGLRSARGFVEAMQRHDRGGQSRSIGRARCSRSRCRFRRARTAWIRPHDRAPAQDSGRR